MEHRGPQRSRKLCLCDSKQQYVSAGHGCCDLDRVTFFQPSRPSCAWTAIGARLVLCLQSLLGSRLRGPGHSKSRLPNLALVGSTKQHDTPDQHPLHGLVCGSRRKQVGRHQWPPRPKVPVFPPEAEPQQHLRRTTWSGHGIGDRAGSWPQTCPPEAYGRLICNRRPRLCDQNQSLPFHGVLAFDRSQCLANPLVANPSNFLVQFRA